MKIKVNHLFIATIFVCLMTIFNLCASCNVNRNSQQVDEKVDELIYELNTSSTPDSRLVAMIEDRDNKILELNNINEHLIDSIKNMYNQNQLESTERIINSIRNIDIPNDLILEIYSISKEIKNKLDEE